MFGFTTISIDAKGRLAIPAKYREQLKSQNEKSIVVTRDPQYPALKIYPGSIWKIYLPSFNHCKALIQL